MKNLIILSLIAMFFGCAKHEIAEDLSFEEEILLVDYVEEVPEIVTQLKSQKKNKIEVTETMIDSINIVVENDSLQALSRNYVLQLSCVTDKSCLKKEQEKLKKSGYETNISSKKNSVGTMYHRLRLNGFYRSDEAKKIGDEIKQKFLNISDYLVLKVR